MGRYGCCNYCGEAIGYNDALFVLNINTYAGQLRHLDHLRCSNCDTKLVTDDTKCYISNDINTNPICEKCMKMIAIKCIICNDAIIDGDIVEHHNQLIHRNCFKCSRCHRILFNEYIESSDGRTFDKDCFWGNTLIDYIRKNGY